MDIRKLKDARKASLYHNKFAFLHHAIVDA